MKKLFWILTGLLWAVPAFGQGGHVQDSALRPGAVIAGATVRVCTEAAAGTPCSPLASIFTDKALTSAKTNPFAADANGNFDFYAAPGIYKIQISAAGFTTLTYVAEIALNAAATIAFTGNNTHTGTETFNGITMDGGADRSISYVAGATPRNLTVQAQATTGTGVAGATTVIGGGGGASGSGGDANLLGGDTTAAGPKVGGSVLVGGGSNGDGTFGTVFIGPSKVRGFSLPPPSTAFLGSFTHSNTANRTYAFPDAPGTVAFSTGAINAKDYGVKADGQVCFGTNVTWTNTSTTVSCSTATFTALDVGKTIFGTNGCCGVLAQVGSTVELPQGTIQSVISATSVTVSLAATATSAGNAVLVWGSLDDAAWDLAEAAWASPSVDRCLALEWPAGLSLISREHFNPTQGPCLGSSQSWQQGGTSLTYEVRGFGPGVSVAVPVPNFDFTTCTFGLGAQGCFFSYAEGTIHDLGFWGGANSLTGTTHNNTLVNFGLAPNVYNVMFAGFGASSTGLIGVQLSSARLSLTQCDGFGRTCGQVSAGGATAPTVFYFTFWGDTAGPNLTLSQSDQIVHDYGSSYGGSTGTVIINQAGEFNCFGCELFGNPATSGTGIFMSNFTNAETRLIGARWNNTATTTNGIFMNDASQTLWVLDGSTVGGTSAAINRGAGKVFDDGTNTYVGPQIGVPVNCSSSASPAVCGSAGAGSFVVAAGATSVTVNTVAVTADSQIFIHEDDSLGTKLGVTCNTGTPPAERITARVAATSFTFTVGVAPVTNPECYSYLIVK